MCTTAGLPTYQSTFKPLFTSLKEVQESLQESLGEQWTEAATLLRTTPVIYLLMLFVTPTPPCLLRQGFEADQPQSGTWIYPSFELFLIKTKRDICISRCLEREHNHITSSFLPVSPVKQSKHFKYFMLMYEIVLRNFPHLIDKKLHNREWIEKWQQLKATALKKTGNLSPSLPLKKAPPILSGTSRKIMHLQV